MTGSWGAFLGDPAAVYRPERFRQSLDAGTNLLWFEGPEAQYQAGSGEWSHRESGDRCDFDTAGPSGARHSPLVEFGCEPADAL